jgi:ATP-binding cassette subfamily B protein
VGERGITLSGGQKQRVTLARALLKNAPILILDDCLTSVDASTEAKILENLKEIFKGKTVIVVSHRISAVSNLDRIIVMEDGEIVESGTHWELIANEGAYYRLYRRQLIEQELEKI